MDIVKLKEKSLAQKIETPLIKYKRTLNLQLIFGVLTMNILTVATTFYFVSNKSLDKSDLEELKASLIKELNVPQEEKIITINNTESELIRLRSQIREEINAINLRYAEQAEKREQFYEKLISQTFERKPASSENSEEGNVLTYSLMNEEILTSKQRVLEGRLYSNLKKEEQRLLETLNLKDPNEQKRLEQFQDEIKIKMAELKTQHYHEVLKFRKEKFLIVNN